MADDDELFTGDLIRMIAAELYSLTALTASREMFGKSYYALGLGEKESVDQTVLRHVGSNYTGITPELLRNQGLQQPVGFSAPQEPEPNLES
jgi:hypothetical protein